MHFVDSQNVVCTLDFVQKIKIKKVSLELIKKLVEVWGENISGTRHICHLVSAECRVSSSAASVGEIIVAYVGVEPNTTFDWSDQ